MPVGYRNIRRACKQCGSALTLRNNRDIERKHFCSKTCLAIFHGKAKANNLVVLRRIPCRTCGEVFLSQRTKHIFCSRDCVNDQSHSRSITKRNTLEGFLRRLLRPHNRDELTVEYLTHLFRKQHGKCAISGQQMTHIAGRGRQPFNISLDQIVAKGGYSRSNVQLVCCEANLIKRHLTPDELRFWCSAILETTNAGDIRKSA